VREPHLDALAIAPGLLEAFRANERSRNVARALMLIARDLT
jgi:hypothetical protein